MSSMFWSLFAVWQHAACISQETRHLCSGRGLSDSKPSHAYPVLLRLPVMMDFCNQGIACMSAEHHMPAGDAG